MAIPDADVILAAFSQYKPSEKAVRAAVREARDLARWELDEPAALFFSFARRPRAVPALNTTLPAFLATEQAVNMGTRVAATRDELRELCGRVRLKEVSFDDVREWFADRMPAD